MLYLVRGVWKMNENLVKWVQEGNISIPQALLTNYNKMNINEEELVLLLQVISFAEKGNDFPTPMELSSRMTISSGSCSEILRRLIQKGYVSIEDGSDNGILYEKYSLQPLWEQLIAVFLKNENMAKKAQQQEREMDLYSIFESEFGRPLSPFECESLTLWLDDDGHEPLMIKAALREAVISGKLNIRYIDRILFEWKKNGVKTIEQAKSYGSKFRPYQNQQQKNVQAEEPNRPEAVPFYNWLEQ